MVSRFAVAVAGWKKPINVHAKISFSKTNHLQDNEIDDYAKDGGEEFLPKCTAFFNRIPLESLKICNSNAMHIGKNSSPPSLVQSSIRNILIRGLYAYGNQNSTFDLVHNLPAI